MTLSFALVGLFLLHPLLFLPPVNFALLNIPVGGGLPVDSQMNRASVCKIIYLFIHVYFYKVKY